MKMKKLNVSFSACALAVLIAVTSLFLCSCGESAPDKNESNEFVTYKSGDVIGEGSAQFPFEVITLDGNKSTFTVKTDKKTVGDALLDAKIIVGEDGSAGFYVKTVNGVTLDYDTDGKYWAFYVNGAYASTGVDVTAIEENAVYCFKAE